MKFSNFFGLLFLAAGAFATCDEELPLYTKCGQKDLTMIKSNKIDEYCKSFETDDCKDLLTKIYDKSECLSESIEKLGVVAQLQLPYLAFCSKTKDNKECPLTTHLKEKLTSLDDLEVTKLSKDLKTAITNDCKDETCNARMKVLEESLKVETISKSAPEIFGNTLNFFQALEETYKDKDKTCETMPSATTKSDSKDKDAATTLDKFTLSFVLMILLSIIMLF